MGSTKIEWADKRWNPITGCSKISPGCKNCYAERMARQRLKGRFGYPEDDPFRVTFHADKIDRPRHWKKPKRVFVNSMGDLFHEHVDFDLIDDIMQTIAETNHTYMILTKRPARMLDYFQDYCRENIVMPDNLWLGVTAENQEEADKRIPILLQIPAAKRFVSIEPCLSYVNLHKYDGGTLWIGGQRGHDGTHRHDYTHEDGTSGNRHHHHHDIRCNPGLDWVIVGAETGPGARPMDLDWARDVRDQCREAGVPFFFKKAGPWQETPPGLMIREFPG